MLFYAAQFVSFHKLRGRSRVVIKKSIFPVVIRAVRSICTDTEDIRMQVTSKLEVVKEVLLKALNYPQNLI